MAQEQWHQRQSNLCGHCRAVPSAKAGYKHAEKSCQAAGAKPSSHAEQFSACSKWRQAQQDHTRSVLQSLEHHQASAAQIRQVDQKGIDQHWLICS